MSVSASPSVLGQALSWAGSAVAAAAVLSGVAALVVTLPPSGDSQGHLPAPLVLTLSAPQSVAALPTPPPEVSTDVPRAPDLPDAPAPAPMALAEAAPARTAAPRLPQMAPVKDAPILADPVPAQPEADPKPAPEPVTKPAPKPKSAIPDAKPAKAKQPPATDPAVAASVAGDAGKTDKATRNDGVKAASGTARQALKSWGSAIRKRIEAQKSYPTAANGAAGTVTVRLTVSRSGQLLGVAVAKSSGVAALDKAAVKAVQSARLPAAPKGVADDSASFTLPMKFAG